MNTDTDIVIVTLALEVGVALGWGLRSLKQWILEMRGMVLDMVEYYLPTRDSR